VQNWFVVCGGVSLLDSVQWFISGGVNLGYQNKNLTSLG